MREQTAGRQNYLWHSLSERLVFCLIQMMKCNIKLIFYVIKNFRVFEYFKPDKTEHKARRQAPPNVLHTRSLSRLNVLFDYALMPFWRFY